MPPAETPAPTRPSHPRDDLDAADATDATTVDATTLDAGSAGSTTAAAVGRPATTIVALVALVVLLLFVLRKSVAPIADPDSLWHVLLGRSLVHTWDFSGPDPLGSTGTLAFTYTQWLPELAAAGADHLGGLAAVSLLAHLARVVLVVLVYLTCRDRTSPLAAGIASAIALVGVWGSLGTRPQLVGLVLLVVVVRAWLATADDLRPRWWLVAVSWVWACSHGTWVFGIALGVVVVAGLALDGRLSRRLGLRLALVPVLGALAALVTPAGLHLVTSTMAVQDISPFIQEWAGTSVHYPPAAFTLVAAGVTLVVWTRRRGPTPWTHLLLLGLALAATLTYLRTIAIGALILAPLLALALDSLVGLPRARSDRGERLVVFGAAASTVLAAAVLLPSVATEPAEVPSGLDDTLAAMPRGTVVYNDLWLGGWLLWQHPQLSGTIDSRAEIYGPARLEAYQRAMSALPGWQADVERFRPAYALVAHDSALEGALEHQLGWTVLGADQGFVLLRAAP